MDQDNKYAFCIIAHSQPELFKVLVNQIDHLENDIYVMIDKKADINQFNNVSLKYSNIHFCENRVDIKWGDYSQIRAELELFRTAYSTKKYNYYHLLSGQDLLIKPVTELNQYMKKHQDQEYIWVAKPDRGKKIVESRLRYYYILPHLSRSKNILIRIFFWAPIKIQKIIGVKRKAPEGLRIGSNWCSISNSFVQMILEQEKNIQKIFKYSICADELYKPYIALKYNIINKCIESTGSNEDPLRRIDWKRGRPYVWKMNDFDELMTCKQFFARKFSIQDSELISLIKDRTNLSRDKVGVQN